jgi:hypothetical protein
MDSQIKQLKAAAGHRCIDFGLLKGFLYSDRPPEGTEERCRFVRLVKEVLQGDPPYREGSGI